MVPAVALDAWRQQAPWPNEIDVEQDLILTRLIVDVARHPLLGDELAFRGGTCLRFDARPTSGLGRIRVKIEINTRETTPRFDHVRLPLRVDNPWFAAQAQVLTFELVELLGTTLRALYQRRKGRDLFDLWLGLTQLEVAPGQVIAVFHHYLALTGTKISRADFERNLADKLNHRGFRADLDRSLPSRRPATTSMRPRNSSKRTSWHCSTEGHLPGRPSMHPGPANE